MTARGLVLVVDDEPEILTAIEDLLDGDFDLVTAGSGRSALAILRERPEISVIVTDQRMPGMSGDALLAAARAFSDAEAILLTGYADHNAVVEAVNRARIVAYIAKPWDAATLKSAVVSAHARWAMARELALERNLLHGLLDHFGAPVSFKDSAGRFLRLNREKADQFGAVALAGRRETELVEPDAAARIEAADAAAIAAGASDTVETRGGEGGPRWVAVSRIHLPGAEAGGGSLVTIERDITEQRELESRLRQADKMQALGTLAGGIAHDFNNLLTAILGSLGLASRHIAEGDTRLARLIGNATLAAERGAALTQRLLSFGRRRELKLQAVDVNHVIAEMGAMLETTLSGVTVATKLQPDIWPAWIDPDQLHLAILNLCVNARDAMPGGGTVTIASFNATVAAGEGDEPAPGNYAMIEVTDTGVGIPDDVIGRVFEPFFTTKDVGKGTGLGLSMVYALVREAGGGARIHSAPGKGTTVSLYLPRSHQRPGTAAVVTSASRTPASALRVLLVDDDPSVREVTAGYLAELGHDVVATASGPAALEALGEDSGHRIGLMVADFTMPGMTGLDAAREARRRRPGLPVLLVTGYADLSGVPPDIAVLSKPFRQEDLAEQIARLRHVPAVAG